MKRRMMLAVLLGVLSTATVEGHRHNAEALPESLADSLGSAKFAKGGSLWSDQGDLLASSDFQPAFGRPAIEKLLKKRYAGWKITLGQVRAWPAAKGDAAGIAFVNWVYDLKKGNDSHKELFVAVAQRRHVNAHEGPVEKDHAERPVTTFVPALSADLGEVREVVA